ncbi:MAG: serine/threonine protein kinase, partial [Cyanobacteria bacterium J083]
MSYCLNDNCSHPKNPPKARVCQTCGSKLLLRNRYRVIGGLGKGGFGTTYLAVNISLPGSPACVIKQLKPATDNPGVLKMAHELFEREAATLGMVGTHPQVPMLLDFFEHNQRFYLIQEYVKGLNLQQEVKRNGTFSEAGIKQFLTEILPILGDIHAQKVIHRDIKPANIIRRETDKKLVLIDFGVVKNQVNSLVSNDQTALTAFAVGTPGFAPPEQLAMRPVYASDIYALGVTCVYLLSGKSPKDMRSDPFTGEILWDDYIRVSPEFTGVLKKMLEVSVRNRYKSTDEVLKGLDMAPYMDTLAEGMVSPPPKKANQPTRHSRYGRQRLSSKTNRIRPQAKTRRLNNNDSTYARTGRAGNSYNTNFSRRHSGLTEKKKNQANQYINNKFRPPSSNPSNLSTSLQSQSWLQPKVKHQPTNDLLELEIFSDSTAVSQEVYPKLDAMALISQYSQGKRDFSKLDLSFTKLQKVDLDEIK